MPFNVGISRVWGGRLDCKWWMVLRTNNAAQQYFSVSEMKPMIMLALKIFDAEVKLRDFDVYSTSCMLCACLF